MNFPTSTHVGRLYVESRHLPATQGGGGDIHDVMATPFGVRLLVGDVMGTGLPANRTGLSVLNAWRDLACTEPSLAGIAVRLHALIARSEHPERFVTALLVNFPAPGRRPSARTLDPGPSWSAAGTRRRCWCATAPRRSSTPYAAPPLGLLDLADGWCRASMIPVGDGDQLLLYTDGVSEARDADGRFFPLAQVTAEAVRAAGPAGAEAGVPGPRSPARRPGRPAGRARRRPRLRRHPAAARDDALTLGCLIACLYPDKLSLTRGEDGMSLGLTRQRPGALPLEVTGFVGRQRELAELTGLLRTARLVTVTGPGGVGKTRVALRAVASRPSPAGLASEFPDGAWLVELSGLRDPELLA